jgi:hypothetical protein
LIKVLRYIRGFGDWDSREIDWTNVLTDGAESNLKVLGIYPDCKAEIAAVFG